MSLQLINKDYIAYKHTRARCCLYIEDNGR